MKQCLRCKVQVDANAIFCPNCGYTAPARKQPSPVVPIKKNKWMLSFAIIVGGLLVLCVVGVVITAVKDGRKAKKDNQAALAVNIQKTTPNIISTSLVNNQNNQPAAPPPTPIPPPTFAELKVKGEPLLKFERNEYARTDLAQFDEVMQPLRAIPIESKDYNQAQNLLKKLIDKSSSIGAEIVVLGDKPGEAELYVAFNRYLRTRLNDYDSSEYVNYTPARKVTVKGEPFWVSILSLRAKNAFGGYILKDVTMYIRNKEVVLADGL